MATKIDIFRFGSLRALTLAMFEADVFVRLDAGARLKKMGFHSQSDWKKFHSGKKALSVSQRKKIVETFKLNSNERNYFEALAKLNESKSVRELRNSAQSLIEQKGKAGLKKLMINDAQIAYYTKWYYIAIRELMTTPYFREDAEWIASRLNPSVSADEVRVALNHLESLGMIKRSLDGKLKVEQNWVSTGDEVKSILVKEFHKNMIEQGKGSMENVVSQLRDISALTFGVSQDNVNKLKELLSLFRKELLAISEQNIDPNLIYQLNLQLFPLSKNLSEGGK